MRNSRDFPAPVFAAVLVLGAFAVAAHGKNGDHAELDRPTGGGATAGGGKITRAAGAKSGAAAAVSPATPKPKRTLDQMAQGLDHTGTPALPKPEGELPASSAESGEERPLPQYDGREPEPPNAADVLIWAPRVLFFPVYLATRYLLRWPLVTLVTLSEKYAVMERINDLLTWDDGKAGVFPRFLADFGLRPHAGLSFFWNELGSGTDIAVSASAWADVLAARAGITTRIFRNDSAVFSVTGGYTHRPDNPYYGKDDPADPCYGGCRYRSSVGEAEMSLRAFFEDLNRVTATVVFRDVVLGTDSDPPRLSAATAAALPGFDGYRLIESKLWAEIDSRQPDIEFEPGTGLRLELMGSFAIDPSAPERRFLRYGGEAAGFWDFGNRHVLAARFYIEAMENVGDRLVADEPGRVPIPFSEYITLGGAENMRGFLGGQLRGRNAWVGTLQYRYPVYALFDATFFFSMGNAFPSFHNWDIRHNYLSYGISFRASSSREVAFELLVGLGTDRLDNDEVNPIHSGRFAIGVNHGF